MNNIAQLAGDDRGATAIEYALIACLIALGIIGGMNAFAGATDAMWDYVVTTLADAFG